MAKKKIKASLKRSAAVISSLALLMSFTGPVYMQADAAVADAVASTAEDGRASKMYIYDEYGNDISDSPIVYLDNSSAAGQPTSTTVTVKIVNPDRPVDEYIKGWMPDGGSTIKNANISASWIAQCYDPDDPGTFIGICQINACNVTYPEVADPYTGTKTTVRTEEPFTPGKTYVIFTSQHGDVSRQLDVVVQEPATDFNVYSTSSTNSKIKRNLNDDNFENKDPGMLVTANHKYQFTYDLVTEHPKANPDYLDKVEWYVFESEDDGDTPSNFRPTDLAEISQDGVFTPKANGVVWVVGVLAPTAKAARKQEMVNKAIASGLLTEDEITRMTVDEYLKRWTGDNLNDVYSLRNQSNLIKYYFSTPAAPFNQIVTDRPFAVGEKHRWIWPYNVDKDTGAITGHKVDKDGNPEYAETKVNYEGIRDGYYGLKEGYYLRSTEYKGKVINVLAQDPKRDSYGNIKYLPVINTPKFISVTIRKQNPAKDLRISKYPDYMEPGEISQLEIVPTPTHNANEAGYEAGATDEWRWVSENPDIVSVDENGVVTAHKEGTASIKVYGETQRDDGSYVSAGCTVQVITKATAITVTPSPTSTRIGVPVELTATSMPDDASDRIIWESTDPNVATVTADVTGAYTNVQKARVVGVSVGTCEIIAKSEASGVEANRCKVTVTPRNESDALKLTTPTATGTTDVLNDLDLFTFHELTINGRLVADDGETSADDTVHWEVEDNDERVSIESETAESITLRGQIAGTVTLKAMSQAQYEEWHNNNGPVPPTLKTVTINVKRSCDKINITRNGQTLQQKNLNVNNGLQLEADLLVDGNFPHDHDDEVSYWMSSDPEIVTVDNNGYVTAKRNGRADVYAYSKSGVSGKVTINSFTTTSASVVAQGASVQDGVLTKELVTSNALTATYKFGSTIKDQTNKAITGVDCRWTSSNPDVATVDDTGLLTATDVGETVITLYSGTLREECLVKVSAPITAASCDTIAPILYTPSISSYEPHPTFKVYSFDENGNTTEKHELVENLDYEISYQGNTTVNNQAKIIITGIGQYQGRKEVAFAIAPRPMDDDDITISYETTKQCMKKATIQDNLNVQCSNVRLEEGVDYKVAYSNNTKVTKNGEVATMTITGQGKYTGSVKKEFVIVCDHHEILNPVITPATYTEPGDEFGTCAICGEKDVHNPIPPLSVSENPATDISFERQFYGVEAPKGEIVITPVLVGTDPTKPATDTLKWTSSNPKVASVEAERDADGNLTGNAIVKASSKGSTTITVFGEIEGVTASCEVKVLTPLTKINLVSNSVETRVSVPVEVNAVVEPAATEDELVWSIQDESVATVEPGTAKGGLTAVITGVRKGTTRVIVKGKYTNITNTFEVKVTDKIESDMITITAQKGSNTDEQDRIPAGINGSIPTYKCFTNDNIKFNALLTDETGGSADGTVIWKVTNNAGNNVTAGQDEKTGEELFDITKDFEGLTFPIHAASLGNVTITATSKDNPSISFSFNLEIAKRCDTITITDNSEKALRGKSLNIGDTLYAQVVLKTLDPTYPYDHGDEVKSWTSSDESVATVDNTGKITAVANGDATIRVTALSGQSATLPVKVFTTTSVYINGLEASPDGSLPISEKEMNKTFDLSVQYSAVVRDQNEKNVQNVDCVWVSSNTDVATVDASSGKVDLHDVGESTITVSSGSKSRSFILKVTAPYRNMIYDPIIMYYDPKVKEYKPNVQFFMGSKLLTEGTDYVISEYKNNTEIGKASMKVTLMGYYTGEGVVNYTISKRPVSDSEVKISKIDTQNYTGKAVTPSVKVTFNGVTLEEGVDYNVSYKNNVEEGTATATVTGKGNYYTGSQAIEFTIKKNASGLMGDMDDDGTLTSGDALTVLRNSVGLQTLDSAKLKLADMDGDGTITSADALTVLRKSVGLG